jgi:peptidoglycan/LPS O-acetylase OafA/YrhL
LAFLGAFLGLTVLLLKWRLFPGRQDPLFDILTSGALNLLMLPSFFAGNAYEHGLYPGDGPLWSLFFELAVNLIWAAIGVRLTTRRLGMVVAIAAVSLAVLAALHGSTRMGVGPETFWGGAARATFGFTLGVLIYRLRGRLRLATSTWGPIACVAALLFAFCGPLVLVHGKPEALFWDLAWIFVALPIVVVLGASQASRSRIGAVLGELSYPVYVLHWPCLAVLSGLRQKAFPDLDPVVFCVLAIGAIATASWMAFKFYDEPVRRRLARRTAFIRPSAIV